MQHKIVIIDDEQGNAQRIAQAVQQIGGSRVWDVRYVVAPSINAVRTILGRSTTGADRNAPSDAKEILEDALIVTVDGQFPASLGAHRFAGWDPLALSLIDAPPLFSSLCLHSTRYIDQEFIGNTEWGTLVQTARKVRDAWHAATRASPKYWPHVGSFANIPEEAHLNVYMNLTEFATWANDFAAMHE